MLNYTSVDKSKEVLLLKNIQNNLELKERHRIPNPNANHEGSKNLLKIEL
jgi:hypothetical protein